MADHITLPAVSDRPDVSGACFASVIDDLRSRTSKRSASAIRDKATEIVEHAIRSYAQAFGAGDVGARGSGRVRQVHSGGGIPEGINGLMYGRVQSGKTNASIAAVALASGNGFRCFVVLTSDNTWLGRQTVERFALQLNAGDGPIVRSWEDWRANPRDFAESIQPYLDDTGIVLISTKNTANLESLADVLRLLGAKQVPGMMLDDEADNASLNTNTARMARDKVSSASAIFEAIGIIRRQMPNHVFVQITATPQSLLMQGLEHPLRPAWDVTIEPGEGYIGGEKFFSHASVHIVGVDGAEIGELRAGKINPGSAWSMPEGLSRAVCFFVTATALKQLECGPGEVLSMLIHIDHKKVSHQAVKTVLTKYLMWLDKALRGKHSASEARKAAAQVEAAYEELKRTHTELRPIASILERLKSSLRTAQPQIIDADNPNQKPEYRPGMNFLIGGNRLGRGVTIEGLSVTYYGRDARTKMMDTVHQHARMFGYRKALLPITRLYSPDHIIGALKDIYLSDEGTRQLLEQDGKLTVKPVWVGQKLRATRANVLNPADLTAITGGKRIWPTRIQHSPARLKVTMPELERLISRYTDRDEYYEVAIDRMAQILRLIPSTRVSGRSWDDDRIQQLLQAMTVKPLEIASGLINVRRGRNGDEGFHIDEHKQHISGFAEGTQMSEAEARFPGRPILLLRKQAGLTRENWSGHPFYAPTLLVPKTKFVFVFTVPVT